MDSIGTLDGTGGTIAAAHIPDFFRELPETYDGLMVVAAKVMVG